MKLIAISIATLALAACTAGNALTRVPRRQIDRPYTLPSGVDSWGTSADVAVGMNHAVSSAYLSVPFSWDLSLTDDWGVLLGSDLGLAHQFFDDGRQRLGASLSFRPAFGSSGVLIAPSLRVDHLVRFSRRWGWSSALFGNASRWSGSPPWGWGAGAGTGPVVQLTDTVALGASAVAFVARSYLVLPGDPIAPSAQLEASFSVSASWSVARQWDLGLAAGYERRAATNGYRQVWATLGVSNYW